MNKKTFIIAEAGSNHNGDLSRAKDLIDMAAVAGCDAVKFQIFSSEKLYAPFVPSFAGHASVPSLIKELELPRDWLPVLKDHAEGVGVEFMATPFDEEAVRLLVELGVKRLKVAGFEAHDPRFLSIMNDTGLPLIITIGIGGVPSSLETIVSWLISPSILNSKGNRYKGVRHLTFLHGNHGYPTPLSDANLEEIGYLKAKANSLMYAIPDTRIDIGYSDHTESSYVPAYAVAMGAQVIEKHITVDRSLPGPDHKFALEPNDLVEMVNRIREAEQCLGTREVKLGLIKSACLPTQSEKKYIAAQRSVVAKHDIRAGSVLDETNITTLRHYHDDAIPASEFFNVMGKKATSLITGGMPLMWRHVD